MGSPTGAEGECTKCLVHSIHTGMHFSMECSFRVIRAALRQPPAEGKARPTQKNGQDGSGVFSYFIVYSIFSSRASGA